MGGAIAVFPYWAIARLWVVWQSHDLDRARKRRLRNMLRRPEYLWRRIGTLSAAIGADEQTTRVLLVQISAYPQARNADMWGLEDRVVDISISGSNR